MDVGIKKDLQAKEFHHLWTEILNDDQLGLKVTQGTFNLTKHL